MFELPGFDPKGMTDDELVTRANDLMGKLGWAARSVDTNMLGQMQKMIEVLNNERRERAFMANLGNRRNESPVMLETDPDLRDAAKREAEKSSGQGEKKEGAPRPRIGVRRAVPTATPTLVEVQPGATGAEGQGEPE